MNADRPGMRLKRLIRAQWPPVTQRAFALRMGISEYMLSHWLADRREPPAGFWAAAARELGIDPSELLPDQSDTTTLMSSRELVA